MLGSSPRIRGKSGQLQTATSGVRIIPANTGKIEGATRIVTEMGDHPREYGENRLPPGSHTATAGSSPRIRGKYTLHNRRSDAARIIPANTGKISPKPSLMLPHTDHPREYGENAPRTCKQVISPGSSPRIRGKSYFRVKTEFMQRIIPANTGKIHPIRVKTRPRRDHPREYGENPAFRLGFSQLMGSSPRIRGKCGRSRGRAVGIRIIPANTGKMKLNGIANGLGGDHPREYGENWNTGVLRIGFSGSSPRIRGKCHVVAEVSPGDGIIPANTGKIRCHWYALRCDQDHPREYGEN